MSPPPLEKVVDAVLRAHTPLTLSDTWTCPAESYWLTQPTSRAPALTGAVSWNVALVTLAVLKVPPCIQCGLGGAGDGVVTGSGDDWAE
jgi:hypothetical protein